MEAAMAAVSTSIAMAPRISRFKTLSTIIHHGFLSPSPIHSPFHHHQHHHHHRGMCDVSGRAVKKQPGETLLKGVPDKATAVKNIIEMANRASSRREVLYTDFHTPIVKESLLALEKLTDITTVSQGRYPQAERCRLSVGHPEIMATTDAVASLRAKKEPRSLLFQEFVEFLASTLDKVGNVPATCTQIPLLALEYEPPKRTLNTTTGIR